MTSPANGSSPNVGMSACHLSSASRRQARRPDGRDSAALGCPCAGDDLTSARSAGTSPIRKGVACANAAGKRSGCWPAWQATYSRRYGGGRCACRVPEWVVPEVLSSA
jgi:hypothetical protein